MMFQIELLGLKTAELIIHPEASLRMNMFERLLPTDGRQCLTAFCFVTPYF